MRAGRKTHLTRPKHISSVAVLAGRQGAAGVSVTMQETRDPGPSQQACFKLSDILLDSDSDDDNGKPRHSHSGLDNIMMDGDQFFDADRNEMFFSAGTEDRTGHASRQELLEGIRNLDYYDHTVFGKMDREDVTVSSAVEAMVEMGKLQTSNIL